MQCHTFSGGIKKRKNAYRNRKSAKLGLRQPADLYGFDINDYDVYRCKECRLYHYGRKSNVVKAKIREGAACHA